MYIYLVVQGQGTESGLVWCHLCDGGPLEHHGRGNNGFKNHT